MWERWGSPDPADFPSLTHALLVAMTSGLIHGARAVLESAPDLLPDFLAAQLVGLQFDDPLNAPDPAVGFRSPTDVATHPALGDLYLGDLLTGQGASFPETYTRLFSCEASGPATSTRRRARPRVRPGRSRRGSPSSTPRRMPASDSA